jgi:hypothetical protein
MAEVYTDSSNCQWHLKQLQINTANSAVFHIPFPLDPTFESKIKTAVKQYAHVAVLCSELHRVTVDLIKANQYPNLTYFTCGYIDGIDSYRWMDWFITPLDFYRNHLELLDKLTPHKVKQFHFDILLGCTRTHREFVYNYVKQQQIDQLAIMTYYRSANHPLKDNPNFIHEESIEFIDTITHSVGMVGYMGETVNLSKIIPISVYNQTAYSIVTETNAENDFVFHTEKIVKPILAQRLFIVIASYNYLKNLRSLGFKTFDCVIDESYDQEFDNIKRYNLACEQILKLSQLPQEEVLEKIKPIVEHNKKVMLETDWLGKFHKELRSVLVQTR